MSLAIQAATQSRQGRMGYGRGDPGLFGSIWKGVKSVGGAALGVAGSVLPGPVGGAARGISSALRGAGLSQHEAAWAQRDPQRLQRVMRKHDIVMPGPGGPQVPTGGITGFMQRGVPGGATGYEPMCIPKGYKLNETGYHLQDGTYVPPQSKLVKIRKTNPLNPRAASKAISRLESAKKATKRLNRITIRKPKCC